MAWNNRAARLFADGKATEDELSAAWSAAENAAESAAESAAWSAAWSATWSAAWNAEKLWQTQRLLQYIDGEIL
mgnify:CR=1 FL=1